MKRLREKRGLRLLVFGLLGALIIPLLAFAFASPARAEDDPDDYSLYRLASNAAMYFSEKNSPEGGESPGETLTEEWKEVTQSAAAGGGLLGYADPEFSVFKVVGWLFSQISGSSQTVAYSTLVAGNGDADLFRGMLDYAHFGAANADLGLDSMSSGISGQIMSGIGGSIMWVAYALALAASMVFWVVIQILQLLNPFMWFYEGVRAISPTFADGMINGGDRTMIDGPLQGLTYWIGKWYKTLNDVSWNFLMPLFFGTTTLGLLLFKKMDRGGAIKKFTVRIVFLGVGLPLLGSMYTNVLSKFNEDLLDEHSGPTRVILMTYVDFGSWARNDRLGIPAGAKIGWDNGHASSESVMSVRTSALAINKQAHGNTYSDIALPGYTPNAHDAWKKGTPGKNKGSNTNANAVFTTFGILTRYLASSTVAASDYESKIKESIAQLPEEVTSATKKDWFVNEYGYGDSEAFGEETDYPPNNHPVLWAKGGLTTAKSGNVKNFTTANQTSGCGSKVWNDNGPADCNLSALSMYNYLNTGFGPDSLTIYSSNNVTSGLTRENHMAISQVGTGPSKFMYWHNALTVLGAISILGFWYAIGMLAGSIKRTFSLVAAIPMATLGAISSISKVIVYSGAMVLEILVTLFMYQFVSELIITLPDIIAGPVHSLMTSQDSPLAGPTLGGIVVVILTLISSLLIMGVAIALLRVRKVVLKAMDEAFTKLVDKFMDSSNTPPAPKTGGGLAPALAGGAGQGAGQALAGKLGGGKMSGAMKGMSGKGPTNAGGLNASATLGVPPGPSGGDGPPGDGGGGDGPPGDDGPHGGGHRGHEDPRTGSSDGDDGSPLNMNGSKPGSSQSDKEIANEVKGNGGLRNFGYNTDGKAAGTSEAHSKGVSDGGKAGAGIAGASGGGGSSSGTSGSGRSGSSTTSSAAASGSGSGSSGLSSSGHGAQFGYNSSGPAAVESSTNAVASSSSGHAFPSGSGTRSGGRGAPTNILSHSAPQKQLGNERPLQKNPRPTNPPKQPQQPQPARQAQQPPEPRQPQPARQPQQPPEPRQPQGGNRQPVKAPQAPVGQPERRPRGSQPRPQR